MKSAGFAIKTKKIMAILPILLYNKTDLEAIERKRFSG
jgi:hypothetical protein